jgi:DNA-binding response OmpR family regulator
MAPYPPTLSASPVGRRPGRERGEVGLLERLDLMFGPGLLILPSGEGRSVETGTTMESADARHLRSPARVLLTMDRLLLAEVVKLALNHGPYITRTTPAAAEALVALQEWQPHLTIIDMDVEGGQIIDQIVSASTGIGRIPVIALTRRGDMATKLAAFERGVDDILVVPFSPEELVARTLAVMRRTYQGAVPFTPTIRLGELEIDILHRRVRAGETELHLTSLEQSLLYLLAANAGRLVTREEILDHLWGTDYAAESNVVDRHIRNLRKKLQNHCRTPRYIATVPGRGYRFVPTTADHAHAASPP